MGIRKLAIPIKVGEERFFKSANVYKIKAENNNFNTDLKQKQTNTSL